MKKILLSLLFVTVIISSSWAAGTYQITREAVQNPNSLERLLNRIDDELDDLRTLANELRTDHATTKAVVDEMKASLNASSLGVGELISDHGKYKSVVDELSVWAETLAAQLNIDTGVTTTTFDETIDSVTPAAMTAVTPDQVANSGPATITAGAVSEQVSGGK